MNYHQATKNLGEDAKLKFYATLNIHTKFQQFERKMKNLWEEYNLIKFSLEQQRLSDLQIRNLFVNDSKGIPPHKLASHKDKLIKGDNQKKYLLEINSLFESYISYLAKFNYNLYPHKLGDIELKEDTRKMLLNKCGTQEIIDKMIEEKIRQIFYGNPIDIFLKDKCNLGVPKNYFKENLNKEINIYASIIAKRNVIVHNSGKVDSKYIKEVGDTRYKAGDKIEISDNYLRYVISLLLGISAILTECYIVYTLKNQTKGRLNRIAKKFRIITKEDFYNYLEQES